MSAYALAAVVVTMVVLLRLEAEFFAANARYAALGSCCKSSKGFPPCNRSNSSAMRFNNYVVVNFSSKPVIAMVASISIL